MIFDVDFMTEENDGIDENRTIKSIREEQKRLQNYQRAVHTKSASTEERISNVYSSISDIVVKLREQIGELNSHKDWLSKVRLELANKNSLSISRIEQLEEGVKRIEGQIKPLFPSVLGIEPQEITVSEPVTLPTQPEKYEFLPGEVLVPKGDESALEDYPFFDKIVEVKQRRAYEGLLILRSFKIRILEKLFEGICDIPIIAKELTSRDSLINERLQTLINFGHVSVDKCHLSDNAQFIISLYKDFKKEAEKEPIYASFVIYPHVILQNIETGGRRFSDFEKYTGLNRQRIIDGTRLLEEEGFVRKNGEGYETIYFGDTMKTKILFKSVQDSYTTRKVKRNG